LNDKYFEDEISSIRNGLREFKDNSKQLNAKIDAIHKGETRTWTQRGDNSPRSTDPGVGIADNTQSPPLSHYQTRQEYFDLCKKQGGTNEDCNNQADAIFTPQEEANEKAARRTKKEQELAAQNAARGIDHIIVRNAAVEDNTPNWLKSHDYTFNKTEYRNAQRTSQLKGAKVNVDELEYNINGPSWLKVHDANPLTRTMAEHRYESQPQESPQIKSAATVVIPERELEVNEPTPIEKRVSRLMGADGFS
jgi:hypothetical protein